MSIVPVFQQEIEAAIGHDRTEQACLPTCFYMLAQVYGYIQDVSVARFAQELDWAEAFEPTGDWLRPVLTRQLRRRYHLPLVSWQLARNSDPRLYRPSKMRAAGYIGTAHERTWYEENIFGRGLEMIVRSGTPVIVTVLPGFGTNLGVHAVIAASITGNTYDIIDPDRRNDRRYYTTVELGRYLGAASAASVVPWRVGERDLA